MMRILLAALVLTLAVSLAADARTRARHQAAPAPATRSTPEQRLQDLSWLIDKLKAKYAYREKLTVDLHVIETTYREAAEKATTPAAWLAVLEHVLAELHDHHATLGTNNTNSPQLIPSGTDIWAELVDGKPTIIEVRPASVAARAGLKPGMVVKSINGEAIENIIGTAEGEAGAYTLRVALAGTHVSRRTVVACGAKGCRTFGMGPVNTLGVMALVSWRKLDGDIGYIRIENSLADKSTLRQFDAALQDLADSKGFILDLRHTPSGGDSDIAEPIMGRFIASAIGYQRVFEPALERSFPKDSWVKDVDPREPVMRQPLVVLVDHWTGSMGEGMAIGFDAAKRATIVGTKMAGLLGGTGEFQLPHTGITVRFPVERLYHVDGTPRENWKPTIWFDQVDPVGPDAELAAGLEALKQKLAAQ